MQNKTNEMIPDKLFKSLSHSCKGYKMHLTGNALEKGYKPDCVLKKGDDYLILESENSSSRKTFVGGMVKAAHFLQGERTGSLVFVIVPKENTKAAAIAAHLQIYFNWLKDKTNLKEVYVIEAGHYYADEVTVRIGGKQFGTLSHRLV